MAATPDVGPTPGPPGGRQPPAAAPLVHARDIAAQATVPRRLALWRARGSLIVATGALASYALLFALVKRNRSAEVDLAIAMRLQRRRSPRLAAVMRLVSWPGFPPQSRIIPPSIAIALWGLGFPLEALFQLLAWGGALLATVAKALMGRDRPGNEQVRVVIAHLGGSSFPSGHVLTYVTVYGFLAHVLYTRLRASPGRTAVTGGLGGLILLVGPSRVFLGHHWPTDVLASYLLGTAYLTGLTALHRWLAQREVGPGDTRYDRRELERRATSRGR